MDGLSRWRLEDQSCFASPGYAFGLRFSLGAQPLQLIHHPLLQLDHAPAAGSLRLGKAPASSRSFERMRDTHSASLPVDVLPLQSKVLAEKGRSLVQIPAHSRGTGRTRSPPPCGGRRRRPSPPSGPSCLFCSFCPHPSPAR